jgi:hypothetical protein
LAFIAVLLFSVCFQGLVAQTHVHGSAEFSQTRPGQVPATYVLASGTIAQNVQQLPASELRHCLLCQAASHTGAFLTPSRLSLLTLTQSDAVVSLRSGQLLASRVLPYGSRQRGPPFA